MKKQKEIITTLELGDIVSEKKAVPTPSYKNWRESIINAISKLLRKRHF